MGISAGYMPGLPREGTVENKPEVENRNHAVGQNAGTYAVEGITVHHPQQHADKESSGGAPSSERTEPEAEPARGELSVVSQVARFKLQEPTDSRSARGHEAVRDLRRVRAVPREHVLKQYYKRFHK